MCRVFGVNRTGFHNWERRAPSDRALEDAWLTERIKRIHDASRGVYGAPRIHAEHHVAGPGASRACSHPQPNAPQRDPSNGPAVHADPPRPGDRNIVAAAPAPMPCLN
jgi:hypothetical protein